MSEAKGKRGAQTTNVQGSSGGSGGHRRAPQVSSDTELWFGGLRGTEGKTKDSARPQTVSETLR